MPQKFVPINGPLMDEREREAVMQVIESGVLTSAAKEGGPAVQTLEASVRGFTGAKHAVAVSSGTAALQAALTALGIKRGDEVLVPSLSYVATANAVYSVGATPVFVDIGDGYTMDPALIGPLLSDRTAAVMPVHLYGHVADMKAIRREAAGLPVIEDAAQSLGSTVHGRHSGTLSEAGCYSLYPGKVATSGEGGIVVTDDDDLYDILLATRNHGITGDGFGRFGINLRMPEVSAAMGAVQMEKLPRFLDARRRNASMLTEMLQDTDLVLPRRGGGENPNWSLYTVSSPDRDGLRRSLNRNGIGAAVYYEVPIHKMPLYRSPRALPATERAVEEVLSLPVHPGVTAEDVSRMADVAKAQVLVQAPADFVRN